MTEQGNAYDTTANGELVEKPAESAEETTEETIEQSSRPDNVPEKFWDAEKGELNQEALLKSYLELEKFKSAPETEQQEETSTETLDEAKAEAESKLDVSSIEQEYADSGQLSDETYQKLEEAGFTREIVDNYIAGREAIADANTQKIYSLTQGEDNYKSMIDWASNNLSPDEINQFNQALTFEDSMSLAVEGLYARYLKNNDIEGSPLGGNPVVRDTAGFESKQEMIQAMADPRMKKDPAYRAKVERRLANSPNLEF